MFAVYGVLVLELFNFVTQDWMQWGLGQGGGGGGKGGAHSAFGVFLTTQRFKWVTAGLCIWQALHNMGANTAD